MTGTVQDHEPVVRTRSGDVRGQASKGIARFLGVPYASPPVGAARHRPPARREPWTGELDATRFGDICPQFVIPEGMSPLPDLAGRGLPMSEDCLTLNIWTAELGDARRPVLVWIHGGAFMGGSSAAPIYEGTSFARDGVVFVSINYRLHALGYLFVDELMGLPGAGNCGVLDQVAALEWVRDNVAQFGGDPDVVTVVGESAGAMSIGALMANPEAHGLFRRAILLSGAAHHTLKPDSAARVARRVLEHAGIAPGDRDGLFRHDVNMLTMSAQQIGFMETDSLLSDEHPGVRTVFAPVIDGTTLPERAIDAIARGVSDGVDVLIGTCEEEYRLFVFSVPESMRAMMPTPRIDTYFGGTAQSVDEVSNVYRLARPRADPLDLAVAVAGDAMIGIPAVRLAEAKSIRGDAVWLERFAWRTPVLDGALGACHALDLPFLFDDLSHPEFLGEDPPSALAGDVHGACVRFARDGDPNGGRLPPWPCYDRAERRVLRLDVDPSLVRDD
ncbi:MAG: carboxylesterase/lipase family protein, partial [Actinobacteria bacterium]|nr:carboxylesterase/lipase family protein [Actinomycetota bacterium]